MSSINLQRYYWRQKKGAIFSTLQKIKLLKLKNLGCNKIRKPSRIEKSKIYGYKNNHKYNVVIMKVQKSVNKKKARKGKIFGKNKNHGTLKRKKNINLLSKATSRTLKKFKSMKVMGVYWINEDKQYRYYEIILVK
ncbi:60S ribosomal protein L15 (nucleomorph) [Lotharella oceanica]|uniref:Ribosomal protein L15 n=1 Tax=Lotharella oceanica TaxID=641309 RepID=A0A060D7P0_9EUKA|nr:60S ribosomal protein L15 [Lotharella oceanica]